MKNRRISLFAALIFLPLFAQAQFEVGLGYLNSTPQGPMSRNIDRMAHGFSLEGAYRIPHTKFSFGLQFAESSYGFEQRRDTYLFDNGYEGDVNIEVQNFFSNNSAYVKYDLVREGFAQPYLQIGGGLSRISTELSIIDPRETFTSDCPKPLETATLVRDVTSYLLLGGGLRFDLSYPIKSLERRKMLFDLRVNYLNGGEVRYMSTKEPQPNTRTTQGENVSFDFASASQPDIIHEYHAGTSYQTRMEFLSVNASLIFVLGRRNQGEPTIWDHFTVW